MEKITYYVKKKIGKEFHNFSVEGKNLHEVVLQAKKLSFGDIDKCGLCGCEDLELSAHVTEKEGYDYVYVRCKNYNCRATLNFGQQKKDDDIFYLRTREITDGPYKGQKMYDWRPYTQGQGQD